MDCLLVCFTSANWSPWVEFLDQFVFVVLASLEICTNRPYKKSELQFWWMKLFDFFFFLSVPVWCHHMFFLCNDMLWYCWGKCGAAGKTFFFSPQSQNLFNTETQYIFQWEYSGSFHRGRSVALIQLWQTTIWKTAANIQNQPRACCVG